MWTPPLELADGVWFGVGDQWVGPATRFTSGWGYVRYALPAIDGFRLTRTDFVPDGQRRVQGSNIRLGRGVEVAARPRVASGRHTVVVIAR